MSTVVPQVIAVAENHDIMYSSLVEAGPVRPSPYFRWSMVWQRPVAALTLIASAPVLLLLILLVRLTSRGAALYRQTRVGRAGHIFTMYKIRSMYLDAESRTGAVWTTCPKDPRITPIGRFLRATHLDEFPQLWNIVKGEMALVGPRPERPEFVEYLHKVVPGYTERLQVPPGVTGLAQVNLPADSDVESVRRKLALDLKYIARGSLLYDLRLIAATAIPLIGVPNDLAAGLVGVRQSAEQPAATHRPLADRRQVEPSGSRSKTFEQDKLNEEADFEVLSAKN
jgi:lipopolysaccharide/colanic/teichoic acid biosynthesis glycosyltransferase